MSEPLEPFFVKHCEAKRLLGCGNTHYWGTLVKGGEIEVVGKDKTSRAVYASIKRYAEKRRAEAASKANPTQVRPRRDRCLPPQAARAARAIDAVRDPQDEQLGGALDLHLAQSSTPTQAARRFGAWTQIGVDTTGRRVTCRCVCGAVQALARSALEAGDSVGCGCRSTPRMKSAATATARPASFASDLAASEGRGARNRHKGGGES